MSEFKLSRIVWTHKINDMVAENEQFAKDIALSITRYKNADWSDMESDEDVEMNNKAIESGEDRIFATYETCLGKIYIITEWDRSVTTILFPDEY